MPQITTTFKFLSNPAAGFGARLATLTVVIKNRDRATQETLGPVTLSSGFPSWLQETNGGAAGYSYALTYTLSDDKTYPPNFVILEIVAVDQAAVTYPTMTQNVSWAGTSTLAPEPGYAPYTTIEKASTFLGTRLDAADWFGYSVVRQTQALIQASDDLDTETYKGYRNFDGVQDIGDFSKRKFPRVFEEFSWTDTESETGIPVNIERATALQALHRLREIVRDRSDFDRQRNLTLNGYSGYAAGRGSVQWDPTRATTSGICQQALNLIQPYLATSCEMGFGE